MNEYDNFRMEIEKEFSERKRKPYKGIIIEIYDEKEKMDFFLEKIRVVVTNMKKFSIKLDSIDRCDD